MGNSPWYPFDRRKEEPRLSGHSDESKDFCLSLESKSDIPVRRLVPMLTDLSPLYQLKLWFLFHACYVHRQYFSCLWFIQRCCQQIRLYRVSQEESSIFWEVTVSAILSKKCTCTCVLFRTVSEIQLFHCTVHCTLHRRATRHVLTRVAKCIVVVGGIFENVLY
jgi:hypothetical protein